MSLRFKVSPEFGAQSYADEAGIVAPVTLESLILAATRHSPGLTVEYEVFDGIDGCCLRVEKQIILNELGNSHRRLFTLGHELGHYVNPTHSDVSYRCVVDDTRSAAKSEKEYEANRFATALLMPLGPFTKQTNARDFTANGLSEVSEIFSTSLSATALRWVETSQDRIAVVCIERGQAKWTRKSNSAAKLDIRPSTAHLSRVSGHMGVSNAPAQNWFPSAHFSERLVQSVIPTWAEACLVLLDYPYPDDEEEPDFDYL